MKSSRRTPDWVRRSVKKGPGKGSGQRPVEDRKQFEANWDRIFGRKK